MVIPGRIERGVVVLQGGASLPEGTEVAVVVAAAPAEQKGKLSEVEHLRRIEIIEQIAALPIEGDTDPFSGRDHDRILYGSE